LRMFVFGNDLDEVLMMDFYLGARMVNRNEFLLFLIFLLLGGCQSPQLVPFPIACEESCRSEEPLIVFLSTEYDSGRVEMGSKNTGFFTFLNEGGKDLVITNISTSCGCTVIEAPNTILKPGQSSEITVTYVADSLGKSRKRILVFSNDPIRPKIELWVSAEVIDSRKSKQMLQSSSPLSLQEIRPSRGTLSPELKKYLRQLNKSTGG